MIKEIIATLPKKLVIKPTIIEIYTDGACKGNPGPGGWAFTYQNTEQNWQQSYGYDPATTNNRMELQAAIEALKYCLKNHSKAIPHIYTDSKYLYLGLNQWIKNWVKKNWHKVKNVELWQNLQQLQQQTQSQFFWVKAHNGNVGNEKADYYANLACQEKHIHKN